MRFTKKKRGGNPYFTPMYKAIKAYGERMKDEIINDPSLLAFPGFGASPAIITMQDNMRSSIQNDTPLTNTDILKKTIKKMYDMAFTTTMQNLTPNTIQFLEDLFDCQTIPPQFQEDFAKMIEAAYFTVINNSQTSRYIDGQNITFTPNELISPTGWDFLLSKANLVTTIQCQNTGGRKSSFLFKRNARTKKRRNKRGAAPKKTLKERREELFDKDLELAILEQEIKNQEEIQELIELFKRNPTSPRYSEYKERKKRITRKLKTLNAKNKALLKGHDYRVDRIKDMEK